MVQITFSEKNPLFHKSDSLVMAAKGNTLEAIPCPRNHEVIAISPDNSLLLMENHQNHWGFYSRKGNPVLYDRLGHKIMELKNCDANTARWSKDSSKLAFYHQSTKHNHWNSSTRHEITILDIDSKKRVAAELKFRNNEYPKTISWTESGEISFKANEKINISTIAEEKRAIKGQRVRISIAGKITVSDIEKLTSKNGCSNDSCPKHGYCSLPKGYSYVSASSDKKWKVIRSMTHKYCRKVNMWPPPFDDGDYDMNIVKLFVIKVEELPPRDTKASTKFLNRFEVTSFNRFVKSSKECILRINMKWNEEEQAFMIFTPDKERNILLKWYYPESQELKTILTVNDFVNLKKERNLLSENPASFVMVEEKDGHSY